MTASEQTFEVVANRQIAAATYRLVLRGDTTGLTRPGQFVNIEVPGFYLRRPLSICTVSKDDDGERLDLIYKVLGEGTAALVDVVPGTKLQVVSGLGNGFSIEPSARCPLVIGGGVGVVPLYYLVQELLLAGQEPRVILGFNSAAEVFLADEIAALGVPVIITTVDGSTGLQGFVTDALSQFPAADYFYTCGPTPMLSALAAATSLPGQISLEERMGCGFGACVGCVVKTSAGMQRVCKEGPVFTREELQW